MKSERHQGNALTGASIKMTNTRYNKCKNPDRSELSTKDLKVHVAIDCTMSVFLVFFLQNVFDSTGYQHGP